MTQILADTLIPDGLPPHLTGLIGAPLTTATQLRDENYLPIANDHRTIRNFIHRDDLTTDDATIRTPTVTYVVTLGYYDPGRDIYGNLETLADRLTDDTNEPDDLDQRIYNALDSVYNSHLYLTPREFVGDYPNAVNAILAGFREIGFRHAIEEIAYDREMTERDVVHGIYRVLNHA